MKILIVEDNSNDRKILRFYLEKHGCKVIEATDGEEGLKAAGSDRPDVVISDALMPVMDGFQFLRAMKTDEKFRAIPFVFYSAVYTGYQEVELARSIGADAFIIKPKEPEEFWDELQRVLKGYRVGTTAPPSTEFIEEERDYLRKYSTLVATKLEEKVKELEETVCLYKQAKKKISLLSAINRVFKETLECATEEETARACLRIAEEMTGSEIGFIGELNPQGHFDTTTISDAGWAACRVPMPEAAELLKNMPSRGINRIGLRENRSWIINDPASHPESVKKPDGHPDIISFMGVPMRYVGGITGMIALANKKPGYTDEDLENMEVVTAAFVEALNRRRAERKIAELNAELNHQLQRLEEANRELEAFSYSVSHDLRAPLRHITGFVELFNKRQNHQMDEKSRHYLQVISDASLKMGTLIDDLLAFSRMGRVEMRKVTVDLEPLVKGVVEEVAEQAGERKITWEIGPMPKVKGDHAMLRLVMVNLLANAVKFTRNREGARIEVGEEASERGNEAVIFVRDNGVGFDMKYVDKLFGLFQRLHGAGEFEGSGVGLANVQRIIHRHGGRIWAEGAPGEGAVFRFTLPREDGGGHD